jgi:hypothetical protein
VAGRIRQIEKYPTTSSGTEPATFLLLHEIMHVNYTKIIHYIQIKHKNTPLATFLQSSLIQCCGKFPNQVKI